MTLSRELQQRIAAIAADRLSGATALVLDAIDVLRAALNGGAGVEETAVALIRGQPSMAGLRTAAALALGPDATPALERLEARVRRAAAATARAAVPLLRLGRPGADPSRALAVVTCSRSALVERTIRELARVQPVRVCCAESRPGLEGEALAAALAAAGLEVELFPDAAIGTALRGADCLLAGADAVSRRAIVNKVGTAALAALAKLSGVPVVVLAGREKIVPADVFETLTFEESPAGVARGGVSRRSPLFEEVPAELVDRVVLDGAAVQADEVEAASLWRSDHVRIYMSVISAYNVLDRS
jgi:translation initiation factor eIF-2B subunit delta